MAMEKPVETVDMLTPSGASQSCALPFIPAGDNWLCHHCESPVVSINFGVGATPILGWVCLGCHYAWGPHGDEYLLTRYERSS